MADAQVMTREANGLDLEALKRVVEEVQRDPAAGVVEFRVASAWQGQTRSTARVDSYTLAGRDIARRFEIHADEPIELLGSDTAPNPQELLMAAFNACIMVGYVAGAALRGIRLDRVEIETSGRLDLRGFLGLADDVAPGYESMRVVVRIAGDGSDDQFHEIHETVRKTSPNWFNLAQPVRIDALLRIER